MEARPAITGFNVLDAAPPRFTPADAEQLAERHFGIRGHASELPSERDQNFLIDAGPDQRVVLKVSNRAESAAVLDMETGAALHAKRADPGLPLALPREVSSGDGAEPHRARVRADDGAEHWVRMFELMPGEASFDPLTLDHDALWAFGRIVARTGRALRAFFHPAAGRILPWDVQHAARLRPLAEQVESRERRELLFGVLDRFEERVVPAWPLLRSQVIHGDISADNTTLDRDRRVAGIIDFGDASHTALVCDISSAWASLVWDRRGDELFTAAAALLDGYQEVTPLE
jgi:Ser/Thr protein kinase RdoA (MazF antagonist)